MDAARSDRPVFSLSLSFSLDTKGVASLDDNSEPKMAVMTITGSFATRGMALMELCGRGSAAA